MRSRREFLAALGLGATTLVLPGTAQAQRFRKNRMRVCSTRDAINEETGFKAMAGVGLECNCSCLCPYQCYGNLNGVYYYYCKCCGQQTTGCGNCGNVNSSGGNMTLHPACICMNCATNGCLVPNGNVPLTNPDPANNFYFIQSKVSEDGPPGGLDPMSTVSQWHTCIDPKTGNPTSKNNKEYPHYQWTANGVTHSARLYDIQPLFPTPPYTGTMLLIGQEYSSVPTFAATPASHVRIQAPHMHVITRSDDATGAYYYVMLKR